MKSEIYQTTAIKKKQINTYLKINGRRGYLTNSLKTIKGIWDSKRHPAMCDNKKYSKYSIGKYSYGEPRVLTWGEKATLKVGKYCSIAEDVTIVLGGEHKTDWITTFPFWVTFEDFYNSPTPPGTKGDVIIGNDVWIGINATILSGVTIGDGAVIGANSLVTQNVEPYTVIVGNPAKLIRKRFDQQTIDELLKIKWWDWDYQRIKENMPLLLSNRVSEFIEKNRKNL
jgi:acetyltransferase-like isoleucine patch superfamily enzyme